MPGESAPDHGPARYSPDWSRGCSNSVRRFVGRQPASRATRTTSTATSSRWGISARPLARASVEEGQGLVGVAGEYRGRVRGAGVDVRVAALDQAVGVEEEHAARREVAGVVVARRVVRRAEEDQVVVVQDRDAAVRGAQQRRRMSGVGPGQPPVAVVEVEAGVDRGGAEAQGRVSMARSMALRAVAGEWAGSSRLA